MDYYVLGATVASNLPWDSVARTSEHTGPNPKLNARNESEDYFSPCQVQVPLNSHIKVHYKALVSVSITDIHKCKRPPGLQGVWADWRRSEEDRSATATWSSALTGATPSAEAPGAQGAMLVAPFFASEPPKLPQLINWRHDDPCKQNWTSRSLCCLGRNSPCVIASYY